MRVLPPTLESRTIRPCGRLGRVTLTLLWALSVVTPALPSGAQSREEPVDPGWVQQFTDPREDLEAPELDRRLRAIDRLGASPGPRSRAALVGALRDLAEGSPPGGRGRPPRSELTPQARAALRLGLARALAQHSGHLEGRQALVRLLGNAADGAEPEDSMALHTAALALARSGEPDAIASLGRALGQSASIERAARQALLAHPPTELAPLLESAASSATLPELLGELGDPRAYDYLRGLVRGAAPERAAVAAWSLYRMGFPETLELARYWWTKSSRPEHRLTAARILVESREPLGTPAFAELLTHLPTETQSRQLVLELAARMAQEHWEAPLLALARPTLAGRDARSLSRDQEGLVLLALARLDRPHGVRQLIAALAGPSAPIAAEALARSVGQRATSALEAVLEDPSRRPWALRILAVREAGRAGSGEPGPREATDKSPVLVTARRVLEAAGTERDRRGAAADVAAAAWALAVASPQAATPLLAVADPIVRRAVARQAFRGTLADAAARRLTAEASRAHPSATGATPLLNALNDPLAADRVATRDLFWLSSARSTELEGFAPPIARGLASRLDRTRGPAGLGNPGLLGDARRWLTADDPALRASAALGLARAETSVAVSLLAERLARDPEAVVRRAAAWALRERGGPAARAPLEQARGLDPDPRVRRLAGAPARPLDREPGERGPILLWRTTEEPLLLTTDDGSTLLLFPDPDGFVGVHAPPGEPWQLVPLPLVTLPVAKPSAQGEASR